MNNILKISKSHAFFMIRLHVVFVTKYRRPVITPEVLEFMEVSFAGVLEKWGCTLEEFGGESDHVHLLISIHPSLDISSLINNLKSATSRKVRHKFQDHIDKFYCKPFFWHRAYYVGSVGTVSLEIIRKYIEKQCVVEKVGKK